MINHHTTTESAIFPVVLGLLIATSAVVYVRRWFRKRSLPAWRAGGFLSGLLLIWVAMGSRLSGLDHQLLTAHMIQHLLLMTLAAPLIVLGVTTLTLSIHPIFCWIAATATLAIWHVPAVFALGMHSGVWHAFQHASFLIAGLLFWWPVLRSWPTPNWATIVYLFFATLPCDILSGFLVFSDRVAYPVYLSAPGYFGLSALADQQLAGAVMWTCVTIVYLVVGTILATRLLSLSNPSPGLEVV